MRIPSRRIVNGAAALATVGMMAFALYSEHVLLLDPCPLCIFQRFFVILLGIVFLIAAIQNSHGLGARIYAALLGLVAAAGAAVAGWHVYMQNLPPDKVPSCGPGFDYIVDNFPFSDALSMIFKGSGQCAEVSWRFLGLTMPAWVLICLVLLGAAGVWNQVRRIE